MKSGIWGTHVRGWGVASTEGPRFAIFRWAEVCLWRLLWALGEFRIRRGCQQRRQLAEQMLQAELCRLPI